MWVVWRALCVCPQGSSISRLPRPTCPSRPPPPRRRYRRPVWLTEFSCPSQAKSAGSRAAENAKLLDAAAKWMDGKDWVERCACCACCAACCLLRLLCLLPPAACAAAWLVEAAAVLGPLARLLLHLRCAVGWAPADVPVPLLHYPAAPAATRGLLSVWMTLPGSRAPACTIGAPKRCVGDSAALRCQACPPARAMRR